MFFGGWSQRGSCKYVPEDGEVDPQERVFLMLLRFFPLVLRLYMLLLVVKKVPVRIPCARVSGCWRRAGERRERVTYSGVTDCFSLSQ